MNGMPHGKGTFFLPNGMMFEGQFEFGNMKKGPGKVTQTWNQAPTLATTTTSTTKRPAVTTTTRRSFLQAQSMPFSTNPVQNTQSNLNFAGSNSLLTSYGLANGLGGLNAPLPYSVNGLGANGLTANGLANNGLGGYNVAGLGAPFMNDLTRLGLAASSTTTESTTTKKPKRKKSSTLGETLGNMFSSLWPFS